MNRTEQATIILGFSQTMNANRNVLNLMAEKPWNREPDTTGTVNLFPVKTCDKPGKSLYKTAAINAGNACFSSFSILRRF